MNNNNEREMTIDEMFEVLWAIEADAAYNAEVAAAIEAAEREEAEKAEAEAVAKRCGMEV